MRITSLLNPSYGDYLGQAPRQSPKAAPILLAPRSIPCPRRQKIPKDAPVFSEGNKIHGIVNYPPYESPNDAELLARHREFQVFPLGEIATRGVRHIPYNSDKKDFLDKTGRDAFEMFQYVYKRPNEEKEYTVVWDYNVGLVRMTPFFKSLKYTKTVPAKALRENPGLKDISYSITGGALVCQGYWMPYQAARAIAATFCYDIRWALSPVFGTDFPSDCLPPSHPGYAKFQIDPAIVQFCMLQNDRFRAEGPSYRLLTPNALLPAMQSPKMHFGQPQWRGRTRKQRRPRTIEVESGYGTDTDGSDKAVFSPEMSPRSVWQPASTRSQSSSSPPRTNISSAMSSPVTTMPPPVVIVPAPMPHVQSDVSFRTKRTHSKVSLHAHAEEQGTPRPQTADTVGHLGASQMDMDAAQIMLSLSSNDRLLFPPPTKRTRRGSTL